MPWLPLLVATLSWAGPEPGDERGVVEVGVAAEVLYPPAVKDPRAHPTYGAAISASIHSESRFKAMVGLGFDHVVQGWLGDPEYPEAARDGRYAGTRPRSYRGQLFRVTPMARIGLENEFAYGYFGFSPGYALRVATLSCAAGPCAATQSVDHGLNLGVSLGAMLSPSMKYGLVVGGEVGLDWAWFPQGHPELAVWSQGMNARLVAGWRF